MILIDQRLCRTYLKDTMAQFNLLPFVFRYFGYGHRMSVPQLQYGVSQSLQDQIHKSESCITMQLPL